MSGACLNGRRMKRVGTIKNSPSNPLNQKIVLFLRTIQHRFALLKNKLLVKLFSSGLQAVSVQVLGAVFFYFVSVYLSKESFGLISWVNAVSIFLTTFLGFGLEQVVVRRIAASERSDWAASAFFTHTVAGFVVTLSVLLLLSSIVKTHDGIYTVLPWFFAAQGLLLMGTPLKQLLNAREKFTPYAIIALISNTAKIVAVLLLHHNNELNINSVMITLISTAGFELVCLLIYTDAKTSFSFKLHMRAYGKLLKEAFTQYISVIFDISLSRMDWILLGIMTSNVILADYSFAYRAYELSRLPMLIIAPIILPRMARLMANKAKPGTLQQFYINSFSTTELFFAMLIPLCLNILWVPIVGLITSGKYGETNSVQFLVLSVCIPMQFFINLLWSISFGAKKYKSVTIITIVCAVTNITLNLVLIPKFNGLGAAIAFLSTTFLQGYLYYRLVNKQIMPMSLKPLAVFLLTAGVVYFVTIHIPVHFLIQLLIAMVLYGALGFLTKQVNRQHMLNFKHFLSR
jgi:O-antigen/teichoic acid export membrane protein